MRSISVRFVVSETDGANAGRRLEPTGLAPGETLSVLFDHLHDEEERDRLRSVLAFDAFEYWGDALHYRSVDPHTVVLYQGSRSSGASWVVPRPPLLEILDDWERFLSDEKGFTKSYRWGNRSDLSVEFILDERSRKPAVVTDSVGADGTDRLQHLFRALRADDNIELFISLVQRPSFSWWSSSGIVRADVDEVRIWPHDESEAGDYALLTRSQFEALLSDWIRFLSDPIPFRRSYLASDG